LGVLPQVIHNNLIPLPIIAADTDEGLLAVKGGDGRRTDLDVVVKGKLSNLSRFNLTPSLDLSKMLLIRRNLLQKGMCHGF